VENYVVLKTDPIRYGMAAATVRSSEPADDEPAEPNEPPSAAASREPITVTPVPPPERSTEATGEPTPLGQ
jgi:hypothetical protein